MQFYLKLRQLGTNMQKLLDMQCEAGADALQDQEIAEHLQKLNGWDRAGSEIRKLFFFRNYYETIAFVNALAFVVHKQDHHPELSVHYNKCVVAFSTHDANGITLNDFICAAKIDALVGTKA